MGELRCFLFEIMLCGVDDVRFRIEKSITVKLSHI
jgi:hypothetical protein